MKVLKRHSSMIILVYFNHSTVFFGWVGGFNYPLVNTRIRRRIIRMGTAKIMSLFICAMYNIEIGIGLGGYM